MIQALRRKGVTTPAIILTALGSTAEKIAGLDAGANDYMSKPFDAGELRARLRAMTRSFVAAPAHAGLWGMGAGPCDTLLALLLRGAGEL